MQIPATDKWGRKLYPLTETEKPIFERLMEEFPEEEDLIIHALVSKPEMRDWELLEWSLHQA